jgi:hypothetical protein
MINNKSPDVITLVQANNIQPAAVQTVTYLPLTSNSDYKMQPFNEHQIGMMNYATAFQSQLFAAVLFGALSNQLLCYTNG